MTDAIITTEYRELGPALSVAAVTQRYRQMSEFAGSVMRPQVDFGQVPGTGDKPSLFKPGAEKLTVFFDLEPRFTLVDREERWDADPPFFFYRYECALYHRETGVRVANAFGSCNSREKKYAWRRLPEWEASAEDKRRAERVEERVSKKGNNVKFLIVPNPDVCDLVNTFDKMAQKRALVAAVLVGTGASEFFTQDVEDLAEFAEAATVARSNVREPVVSPAPAPSNGGNGHLGPNEWLGEHAKIVFACKQAHPYLQPLQIAERLSTLGVDPAGGEAAALAALGPAATTPGPAPEPEPAAAEPTGPAVTPDMAGHWLEELRAAVAADQSNRAPSEKMTKFAIVLLNECFPQAANQEARDIARHQFLEAVDGEPSLGNWTFGQVKALLDALTTKDDTGRSVLDDLAAGYVRQTVQAALVAAGQQALDLGGGDDDLPF